MHKTTITIFLLSLFLFPFTLHASEGIPLQKDIILNMPILGPEDLPEEVTFTLYGAQDALTPLGSQTFTRGLYTVDFEFSQSDGVTGGSVARIKAEFTNNLNLKDDFGEPVKPKELWTALEVAGAEVGPRSKVSDETLVRLLLNSDASLATYLTLAYEGDENPITTIYKDLPMSFVSSDGSKMSLADYFSGVVAGTARESGESSTVAPYWERLGGYLFYNNGKVGIGETTPEEKIHIKDSGKIAVFERTTNLTDVPHAMNVLRVVSSGNMVDGFGARIRFEIEDNGGVANHIGFVGAERDGADNLGRLVFYSGRNGASRNMLIDRDGNVGIGTTDPTHKLAVNGTIRCKELIVDTGWADFVFEEEYRLPPLDEVERFISQNRHLPGIPAESEVKSGGVSIGDISSKFLQKIEELTLYVIDIKKENESLKAQLVNLEAQLIKIRD